MWGYQFRLSRRGAPKCMAFGGTGAPLVVRHGVFAPIDLTMVLRFTRYIAATCTGSDPADVAMESAVSSHALRSPVNVRAIDRSSIAMEFPPRVRTERSAPAPIAAEGAELNADDLGLRALIDFRCEWPVTLDADSSINEARTQMIRLGVDALLVTADCMEEAAPRLVGLIAAADIERERTHQVSRATDCSNGICAGELVTPWDDLPVMNYEALRTLTVHDLCEMFRRISSKHLLVLEIHDDELVARGLFSRSTISKDLWRAGRNSR